MIRRVWFGLLPLLVPLCSSARASEDGSPALDGETRERLKAWYDAVGPPRSGESFGRFVARTAFLQHGVAYEDAVPLSRREHLRVELSRFECVTFLESSLSLARCAFGSDPTASCFERELTRFRYRDGVPGDASSRLHYFVDWIYDNEGRRRVQNLTPGLGGVPIRKSFFYVTQRALPRSDLPAEEVESLRREIRKAEDRLSSHPHLVLSRERAASALRHLESGDILAFARERPGLLVHHAAFVYRVKGEPRLLHASSYHRRVVLTSEDVASYLSRRPERKGVLVVRPLPPEAPVR